jgi:hypothetical protein
VKAVDRLQVHREVPALGPALVFLRSGRDHLAKRCGAAKAAKQRVANLRFGSASKRTILLFLQEQKIPVHSNGKKFSVCSENIA